nr:hypothetical protein [Tanacetum cinerariifolium]
MDNKKHIVNLESFREMLHICPRILGQAFAELPFEEEILDFIRFLGHSATIRTLTDVNINKIYQPWRSFAAIINKCLTGKTSGYDSLRLSQAQILWGLYHKRNVDYAFLIWEDFVYQVEHKNHKKSNEMSYPRFIKVIIHHFMLKDLFIPMRNKVNWHYIRDDFMFSTIKLVSRHQTMQQFGAMLPIEVTNEEIRNSKAYKEYYVIATGEAAPKPKGSARRTKGGSDTSITPPTAATTPKQTAAATPKLTATTKGKQTAKARKAKSLSARLKVAMTEAEQLKLVLKRSRQQMHISQPGGSGTDEGTGFKLEIPDEVAKNDDQDDEESEDDDEEGESDEDDDDEETRDEKSFDPILCTPESSEDEGDGEEDQGLNVDGEEHVEEEEEDELYRDVNINQGRGLQATLEVKDSHVTLTLVNPDGQQKSSSVSSQFVTSMLNLTSDAGMESIFVTASSSVAPLPISTPTMTPSTIATITTASQAPILSTPIPSKFAGAVSSIPGIVNHYMDQRLNETVKVAVKEQVKAQVSKILPRIEQAVNEQLEAEVLTRNLYKALADAYQSDKIILETYKESVTLKRRRNDDEDKDEEPSAGPDRGSKRRREGKEPNQQALHQKLLPRALAGLQQGPDLDKRRQPQKPPNSDRDWNKTLPAVHESIQPVDTLTPELLAGPTYKLMKGSSKSLIELEYHLEEVYKATIDQLDWVSPEGQQYPYNLLQPLPLIPDNRGRRVIPFAHFINNDLEYTTSVMKTKAEDYRHIKWIEDLVPRTMWIQEPIDYDKHALWGVSHWGRKHQQFYDFAVNRESARNVYSKRKIVAVTELKIVEWHNYKHLDWITIRRDDDKLYKFKEGDFKRLRLQDIKDMLLLLVQGKLSNLTVEERFAFNVSLRMFTRSIIIQRRVEDL